MPLVLIHSDSGMVAKWLEHKTNRQYRHGNISQHIGQQIMRAIVRTLMIRDRDGYEVRDYGNPEPKGAAKNTILGGLPSGIHIVGRSGSNETYWLSNEQNVRLWEKARTLNSPETVAEFMSRWGQITRWLTDEGDRPYEESYLLIEPHLKGLSYLADLVDAGDKFGFCWALHKHRLLDRANITVDVSDSEMPVVIEAPSLLRFLLFEMWNEFGGDRPAHAGMKSCSHCGSLFPVGGRRGTRTRRGDAQYCSDSCKNMASRRRKLTNGTATPISQQ